MDDTAGATGTDTPRPVATAGDNDFTLSIEQVSERYAAAGHPRTIRTLQRYCASGHLDAQKIATTLGDKYLVTPLSVARHIAQIQELSALDNCRDRTRRAAAGRDRLSHKKHQHQITMHKVRQAATWRVIRRHQRPTCRAMSCDLEREVEQAKDERDFLREQIDRKDRTIDSLIERDRETNYLIRGLQNLIPRLTMGRDEPEEPTEDQPIRNLDIPCVLPAVPEAGATIPQWTTSRASCKRSSRTSRSTAPTRLHCMASRSCRISSCAIPTSRSAPRPPTRCSSATRWHNNLCFPGQDTLAKALGMSIGSVNAFIKELERCGLIEITRRGQGKTNLYTINFVVKKQGIEILISAG